jgi:hypothetical protein
MVIKPAEDDTRAKCTLVIILVEEMVTKKRCVKLTTCSIGSAVEFLPPSCIAEPPSVHLAHITHSDYSNRESFHACSKLLEFHLSKARSSPTSLRDSPIPFLKADISNCYILFHSSAQKPECVTSKNDSS